MKRKIVQFYGLETHSTTEDEDPSSEDFRVAFCNLNMTIKDGCPAKIPTLDYLYVGSIGSAYNSEKLMQTGITHILCLSDVIRLNFPERFIYLRVPMVDQADYDIKQDFARIFEFIEQVKAYKTHDNKDGKILVHCYQGKSRSCAVCCAYLMVHYKHSLDSALELIRQVRPIASPNSGFMSALRALEQS